MIYVLTEILWTPGGDSCEVLTVGNDHRGRFAVINDWTSAWPIYAQEWRGLASDSLRWIHQSADVRR